MLWKNNSKKRGYSEMMAHAISKDTTIEELFQEKEIYPNYPTKIPKKHTGIDTASNESREMEMLLQLQRDLQNLKIQKQLKLQIQPQTFITSPTNEVKMIDYSKTQENELDMPEILTLNWKDEEKDNEEQDTRHTSFSCDNDIPFICQNAKITDKIIANALESEKTVRKIFDFLNPSLQPNERNGIILYDDMKKYRDNLSLASIVKDKLKGQLLISPYNNDDSMDITNESSIFYEYLGDEEMMLD